MRHPSSVLFPGEKPFPVLPAVDHYAGSEKLMKKAIQLQNELGPVFDITCDCEDGARAGAEREHAEMSAGLIMSTDNRFGRVAARIHDFTHDHWCADLDILIPAAGSRLPFVTFPKPRGVEDVRAQIAYLREVEKKAGLEREIPVHVLIETLGALHDAWAIAALPGVDAVYVASPHSHHRDHALLAIAAGKHVLVEKAFTRNAAEALEASPAPPASFTVPNPFN